MRRGWTVFAFGFLFGIGGIGLLFIKAQCRQIGRVMAGDFRLLAFLRDPADQPSGALRLKVVEEKLRALPGTSELRFVSKEQALADLENQDPSLKRSVALLGGNPLPDSFEASLAPGQMGRLSEWVQEASAIEGISDVHYKPTEAKAILRLQFYEHFAGLVLGLAWLVLAALSLGTAAVEWFSGKRPPGSSLKQSFELTAGGFLGSALGIGLGFLIAYPLREIQALWSWPDWKAQFCAAVMGAMGGWVIGHAKLPVKNHAAR
ncbi:MAG: hypothetical protein HY611_09940 [Elusimicrobia bacterium]|nr:hypothetical protein [Elusimicrobiota bacterium]